jgi:transcriptional regulator with XRE-family HTH domain
MKFTALQDKLRKTIWEQIHAGDLTGLRLARQTGFQQAHISNFLNRKRRLSLEAMDKVLSALHLSVLDLIDPLEVNKRASIFPVRDVEFENVVAVDPEIAATHRLIRKMDVKEVLKFRRSFLTRLKIDAVGDRRSWDRFVTIKADAREGMSMYPRLVPGATLLLDRHYNSLTPARKGEKNIYAVRKDGTCTIKYVEVSGEHLILRPHNPSFSLEVITMEDGRTAADYIVGRVCHAAIEV